MPILPLWPAALSAMPPFRWTAKDGTALTLRPAHRGDVARQRAFIDGLSRESRYFRFLTGGLIHDDVIAGFVGAPDALVATLELGGVERIVGNGHFVRGDDGAAEFAVVVADEWQGRGLGRELIRRLIEGARLRGLRVLHGEVLSENRRMLAILRDTGFAVRRHPGDSMLHVATLSLRTAAQAPLWLPEDWFAMR